MDPSGSEMAKVMVEYAVVMWSTGLSHLGCMAKKAFLSPGMVLTSFSSTSVSKRRPSLSLRGVPCAMSRVQPSEGHSLPVPWKGSSSMCSYEVITSKGTYPSNEYTKFPLLLGWMLQRPVRRGIGLTSVLAIFSLTSWAMASAARARM